MTASASDRNLLFGILALQMDFITRDGLIDGMQAWTLDKTQSLGEVLVDRDLMPQSQRDVLEQLVDAHITQHGGDAQQSLKGLTSVGITPQSLQSIADPDVQASLLHVPSAADREAGLLSRAASAADFDEEGRTLVEPQRSDQPELRFQILRPHAEGGLGRVSIAVDREFNREVAFKEIKSQHRASKDAQQRFMLEAEVTGGLEHPGIVPVYGLGHFQDGRPFYAMRFIRGDSLKVAIDTFHQQRAEATSKASRQAYAHDVQFRDMISRFIDVCFAMEYAHSRGVLHRDLKPGNIMLGKYGETLVVDWGLAKADAESTQAATGDLDQETPLVPGSGDYGAATQMGRALGTPQFMSPEQAAGRLDELGPTTDVYSLGATLYQVLTGVAPIGASTTGSESDRLPVPEILRRVQTGQFPHPRSVNPDVPAGLDAICLKAMSRNPKDRYPTAKALLADLKAWMADEPVAAWTEPLSIRARRWVRGHQVAVGIAATALLILATVSPVMTLQQSRIAATERQNAATEKENARKQAQLRTEAEVERENAIRAQQAEAKQRQLATDNAAEAQQNLEVAERNAFTSDMLLAQRAWEDARIGNLNQILARTNNRHDLTSFESSYWTRLVDSYQFLFTGHTGGVSSVSFSPDGTRIASGSDDETVKIWNLSTGEETLTLEGHTSLVFTVTFSPNGKRIASGSGDDTVKIWDAISGKRVLILEGHTDLVGTVVYSPDGKRIASGSEDDTVKLWDAETAKELITLKGHTDGIQSVAFSPDGNRLASASRDLTVKVWDVDTGQETLTLKGHADKVNSVCFSPNGTRLVSASHDKTVKLWDAATGREALTLGTHNGYVYSACFSPDGTMVASSEDNTVKVWSIKTGQELRSFKGHTSHVTYVSFSPDGSHIASGSTDRTIKVWAVDVSQEVFTLSGRNHTGFSATFSPDGKWIASGGYNGDLKVWDAGSGLLTHTLEGHTDSINSVAFSPDGQMLASAGSDGMVKLWDAVRGQETLTLKGHTSFVQSVAFSPDGKRLASADGDETVKLWDPSTGRETLSRKVHTRTDYSNISIITSVCFSPDSKQLATASGHGTVNILDAATGKEMQTLGGHAGNAWVRDLCFSPNGKQLASASERTVKVWDVATGQETLTLKEYDDHILSVSFSPDGRRIASTAGDSVKFWDAVTGRETLNLHGHTAEVRSINFSRDGLRLVSNGWDGTVKVWDARPWTPELRAQSQARSLLTTKRMQMKSLEDLQAGIRSDQTVSELVRQQALDWSERFWKNHARQQKERALQQSTQLNTSSWQIVKQPELPAEKYQPAFEMALQANSLVPDNGPLLNTLGVAQYRVQDYTAALKTLTRSEQLNAQRFGGESPHDLVFLAMTRFQLGEQKLAEDLLKNVKAIAAQAKKKDAELDAFIKEAESLIQSPQKLKPAA